jgi:uncharacterized membrane protein
MKQPFTSANVCNVVQALVVCNGFMATASLVKLGWWFAIVGIPHSENQLYPLVN